VFAAGAFVRTGGFAPLGRWRRDVEPALVGAPVGNSDLATGITFSVHPSALQGPHRPER